MNPKGEEGSLYFNRSDPDIISTRAWIFAYMKCVLNYKLADSCSNYLSS